MISLFVGSPAADQWQTDEEEQKIFENIRTIIVIGPAAVRQRQTDIKKAKTTDGIRWIIAVVPPATTAAADFGGCHFDDDGGPPTFATWVVSKYNTKENLFLKFLIPSLYIP